MITIRYGNLELVLIENDISEDYESLQRINFRNNDLFEFHYNMSIFSKLAVAIIRDR